MPGVYTVEVQRNAGYGFTRLRPAEDGGSHVTALVGEMGVTAEMDIAMGEALTGVNAGMLPASTVSGVFFHDVNDNGLRDENEIGMLGAEVRLVSEDGEIDLVQTPAEDGTYFFDGVMPGRYTLHYLLGEHREMAKVAEGGNTVAHDGPDTVYGPFEVVMGEALTLPVAGAVTLGNFSGAVFEDLNANGQWDEGEKALAGAAVTLTPRPHGHRGRAGRDRRGRRLRPGGAAPGGLHAHRRAAGGLHLQLPAGGAGLRHAGRAVARVRLADAHRPNRQGHRRGEAGQHLRRDLAGRKRGRHPRRGRAAHVRREP